MITVIFDQPHSGKTTLANKLQADYYIDGDHLRKMFENKDYSREGRIKNLNRASDIATYLHYNGHSVILSLVYPYNEAREYLNSLVPDVNWVYLTYDEERGREQFHVEDFDTPETNRTLHLNTSTISIEESIEKIKEVCKIF